jgi:hypothetical protein
MRFLCSLVEILIETLKLMTLKLGDPEASPPFGCADQRCKRQFQHRSFPEEGEGRLGAPVFPVKDLLKEICRSDGALN